VKFSERQCEVLHLRRESSMHQYRLGASQLESSIAEGESDHEPMMCPCGKEAQQPTGLR